MKSPSIEINDTTTISDLISMDLTENMNEISRYAIGKCTLFLDAGDDTVFADLIIESCARNTIVSRLSLEHLQQFCAQHKHNPVIQAKLGKLDEEIEVIDATIEDLRKQQREALPEDIKEIDYFSEEEIEFIKNRATGLRKNIISDIRELSLGLSFPDQIETLEGCFKGSAKAESFKQRNSGLLTEGITTRIDDFISVLHLLKLPAKIAREKRQRDLLNLRKAKLLEPLSTLSRTENPPTFAQFLDESLTNLKTDLAKDLMEHEGFIHKLLEYRENKQQRAGISFAFRFADHRRVATVTPSFDDEMYHCLVIPMSDTVSQVASSYYGLDSTHFDTLGHEALHLTSMRCGLITGAPMLSNAKYPQNVVKAIELIKGKSGLYSATHVVMNEDEVIANFVGDIVLNDPKGVRYADFRRRLELEGTSNPDIIQIISDLFSRYSSIAEKRGLILLKESCDKVVITCSETQVLESGASAVATSVVPEEERSGSRTAVTSSISLSSLEAIATTHKEEGLGAGASIISSSSSSSSAAAAERPGNSPSPELPSSKKLQSGQNLTHSQGGGKS